MLKYLRYFFIAGAVLLAGCKPESSTVINPAQEKVTVISLLATPAFNYSREDSTYRIQVLVSKAAYAEIYADVYSPKNVKLTPDGFKLYDNGAAAVLDQKAGDSLYSNFIFMKQSYERGVYRIEYTLRLPSGDVSKAGSSAFIYDNAQTNVAPVLTTASAPDTVSPDVPFVFSATVTDANGLNDVKEVVFRLYRPDNSVVANPSGGNNWQMYDDGNLSAHGDAVAGDGIYSFANYFTASSAKGTWKFEFQAKDRSAFYSNVLTKSFVLR